MPSPRFLLPFAIGKTRRLSRASRARSRQSAAGLSQRCFVGSMQRIMNKPLLFAAALFALSFSAQAKDLATGSLADLAKGHEQVFKEMSGGQPAIVLQRGEKQFVIYGVTAVRAVGSALEVTVKNGQKYSVNPTDVFFITNDSFGLK
jgi:hypothetical protein